MKRASITEAKNGLSSLLDSVKRGSPVLIVDRGRPVARLEPVTGELSAEGDGRLMRLVREGVVRPARSALARELIAERPPRPRRAVSAVEALIADRREGR